MKKNIKLIDFDRMTSLKDKTENNDHTINFSSFYMAPELNSNNAIFILLV